MSVSDAPLMSMPLFDVARSDQALVVISSSEKDVCPIQEMTSISQTPGDDLFNKDAPIASPAPG